MVRRCRRQQCHRRNWADGETFSISDGCEIVTFEFDKGNWVASGHVAVPFTGRHAATVASSIVAAINALSGTTAHPLYVEARMVVVDAEPVVVLGGPQRFSMTARVR